MNEAWKILEQTVYNGGLGEFGPESIIVSRPTINAWADRVRTKLDYNPKDLVKAWKRFINAAGELQNSEGFQYDIVDISRQVLANYATPLQQKWVLAYLQHDTASFHTYTSQFIELMDDMDALLNTRKDFLLGSWIADARSNGADDKEKDLYELNARNLVTLWGDRESELHEYSNRQWAGLIKGFYKPRWQQFFARVSSAMSQGKEIDKDDFAKDIRKWEWQWVNKRKDYPVAPRGKVIETVKQLYHKYRQKI